MKLGKKLGGWQAVREVILAVYQLDDDKGSKKHDIQRYIRLKTDFRSFNCKRALNGALKTGLIKIKNGHFFPVSKETLFSRHRQRRADISKTHGGGRKTVRRRPTPSSRLSYSERNSTRSRKKSVTISNNLNGKTTRRKITRHSRGRCSRNFENNKRHTKKCKKARFTPSNNRFDGNPFPLSYFS